MALIWLFLPLGRAQAGSQRDPNPGTSQASQIVGRAQHEIAGGRVSKARSLIRKGIKEFPGDAALWNLMGATNAEENQRAKAKRDFQRAIALNPRYAAAYLNLGHLEEIESTRDSQALTAAFDTYRRLLEIDPENVEGNFQYALLTLEEGRFADSLAHLRHIPDAELARTRAQVILCADWAETGHVNEARLAARRLFDSPNLNEPDFLPAVSALATHGQVGFAISLLEGLQRRGLASVDSLEELGSLEELRGRLKEARSSLEDAAGKEPENAHLLARLASIANRQQDYRGALGYLAHARALEPENAGIHFFFGMVCVELDLHEESYESLKKAVSLDPDNPYYNYALGAVCLGRTDANEAVSCFEKYCRLKPNDPRGSLALGAAYYYAHNLSTAQTVLSSLSKIPVTATAANYYRLYSTICG